MMRIFVTGGTGFIGENVARNLKLAGHTVTIQGRDPVKCKQMREAGFKVVQEDITESISNKNSEIKKACAENDIVINCAGNTRPYGTREDYQSANVDFVEVLIQECKAYQKKLIHLSSASVYANLKPRHHLREDDALPTPASSYSASKQEAEKLIQSTPELNAIILRPQLVYGASSLGGPSDEHIFSRVVELNNTLTGFLVFNEGKSLVDLTHIDNFLQFINVCVTSNEMNGKTFNVTDGKPTSFKDIIEILFSHLDVKPNTKNSPLSYETVATFLSYPEKVYPTLKRLGIMDPNPTLTPYSVSLMAIDQTHCIDLARKEGYNPTVSLDEGLAGWAKYWKKKHSEIKQSSWTTQKKVSTFCVGAGLAVAGFFTVRAASSYLNGETPGLSSFKPGK